MVQYDPPRYRYRVDANDAIVWVDSMWLAFARENGAPQLTAGRVIGQCLWNFIEGAVTQELYRQVHARVRQSGQPAVIPCRCDSPGLQRHLRLTIRSYDRGELQYESLLVQVTPQPVLQLLNREALRSESVLTLCSCCKKALLEPIGWQELERVSDQLGLFDLERLPEMQYDVCPACATQISRLPDL